MKSFCKRCSKGLISPDPYIYDKENEILQEFFDVKCVIEKCKPLAALDMSKKWITKKRKQNFNFYYINQVINEANKNKIVAVQKSNVHKYLNTVFCNRRNLNKAYKLLKIIHEPNLFGLTNKEYHYLIGKLLGYSKQNIIYFLQKNNFGPISKEEIENALIKLKHIQVNRNDPTISIFDPIPLLV